MPDRPVAARRRALFALALLASLVLALLAGCGGSEGSSSSSSSSSSGGSGGSPQGDDAPPEVLWPLFGRTTERTRAIREAPTPPYHFLWQFYARQLVEFSPVVDDESLYVLNKSGGLYAVDIDTGKPRWDQKLSSDVTGPALSGDTVFVTELDGRVSALDRADGRLRWRHEDPSGIQSSPLVADGSVLYGTDSGEVVALDDSSGKQAWRAQLDAPVKASPSFSDGVVYVGDYRGTMYALDAKSGELRWKLETGKGGFYSSPAIASGRVFEARDDGTVVAASLDGKLDWSVDTKSPIYGSPSITTVDGLGETVYIGNYAGKLLALDAKTGKQRWSYDVGGQIPGSPTIVGDAVFTSSFDTKKTTGLDLETGRKIFSWGSAGYDPVISDGEKAFLTGFQTVWAFEAKSASKAGSGG
ncbi:PQQ-binding-like beta-propeller repeat protein [Thermoleophilia bacterium SCSIO 60948]|nr:PQQ-binding-like beta-propeller repeat protein [Thermoleophilia bacterium SCSIO 60948]